MFACGRKAKPHRKSFSKVLKISVFVSRGSYIYPCMYLCIHKSYILQVYVTDFMKRYSIYWSKSSKMIYSLITVLNYLCLYIETLIAFQLFVLFATPIQIPLKFRKWIRYFQLLRRITLARVTTQVSSPDRWSKHLVRGGWQHLQGFEIFSWKAIKDPLFLPHISSQLQYSHRPVSCCRLQEIRNETKQAAFSFLCQLSRNIKSDVQRGTLGKQFIKSGGCPQSTNTKGFDAPDRKCRNNATNRRKPSNGYYSFEHQSNWARWCEK